MLYQFHSQLSYETRPYSSKTIPFYQRTLHTPYHYLSVKAEFQVDGELRFLYLWEEIPCR
jgi:hypothetical protein